MPKQKKMRGSIFKSGHQALTRGILKDSDVTVQSVGSDFYNANDFPTIYWMVEFTKFCKKENPQTFGIKEVEKVWRNAKGKIQRVNKIVIAETPTWVTQRYINQLDGGILHEAFHSLYTERGTKLNTRKMAQIMDKYFDPEVNYGARHNTLKKLNNIFEDAYIERLGIKEFRGAQDRIQAVHELVWEREKYARRYRPLNSPMVDDNGHPIKDDDGEPLINPYTGEPLKSFSAMDHLTCYLRDKIEHHLFNAPFDDYNEDVVRIVDTLFKDIIKDSDKTTSSYDVFELALRSVAIIADLFELVEAQQQQQNQQGPTQPGQGPSGNGQGQPMPGSGGGNSPDPGDPEDGEGDEEGDEQDTGSGDDEESDEEEEGSGGSGDDEEEEDSDGDDDGDDTGDGDSEAEEDPDANNEAPKGGDGDEQNSIESGDPEEAEDQDEDDLEDIDQNILDDLSDNDAQFNGMKDTNSALKQEWDDQSTPDAPPSVLPFSRDVDTIIHLEPKGTQREIDIYNKIADKTKRDTLYIRPRMVSFFRGQKKSRMKHRQEKGRRLSSRSISEVVYKKRPRPFMKKVKSNRRNSAVSLVLDESQSMCSYLGTARQILATLALTIGELRVPLEIIGFTTNENNALRDYLKQNPSKDTREFRRNVNKKFSRTNGCRYRVFRSFDEPFNINSYRKLTQTEAYGLTPLPDAIEFCGNRLMQRLEDQKIMFVVTDGYPCYTDTSWTHEDYFHIMERQIETLQTQDVEVMFIGVGYEARYVEKYPNSLYVSDMDSFPALMTQFIFDQMRRLLSEG